MALEKILNQIKEDTQKETNSLKESYGLDLKEIDKEEEKKISELEKNEGKRLNKERERALLDYEKDKEFDLNMKLLGQKRDLLDWAISQTKEKTKDFSASQKREIFQGKVKEIEKHLKDDCFVLVPVGKRNEIAEIFDGFLKDKITEKEIGFEDGFIIENDKFLFKVSLSGLVDEIMEKEKDYFASLFFKQ